MLAVGPVFSGFMERRTGRRSGGIEGGVRREGRASVALQWDEVRM
jgi:hypothetical protein